MGKAAFSYHVQWNNCNGYPANPAGENSKVYSFWHNRWAQKFNESGFPPPSWETDFFQHDVVTWLACKDDVLACHLYSFYDLNRDGGAEYFKYLNPKSIQEVLNDFGPRTMTMEYLCASGKRGEFPLSLGATMIALGSRLAFGEGCGSVLGMPIDGTSVSRKVKDLGMGARCVETGIKKYGYQLRLLATNPYEAMANEPSAAKSWLNDLWDHKQTLLQHPLVMSA